MTLTHGWLLIALQIVAAMVLLAAVGWRSRRWRLVWVPVAAVVGGVVGAAVYAYIGYQGWSQDPAPAILWLWIALTGLAIVLAIVGWRGAGWWRRAASVLAVPLCLLCVALSLNVWVGYFPTVQSAWDRATGVVPARWVDQATVADMQRRGVIPTRGVVVMVTTPDTASGFAHRTEYIYLPPAWFATKTPPRLPAVMMFGGEFGHPDDLLRSGVLASLDQFSAKHRGNAPVMVFPDTGGQFANDTECVNGTRGNSADHIVKDVVPFVISQFGVSADAANWGLAGWSAGGTCALVLSVLHPELFGAFVDIDGQLGPNAGTLPQTIARLFGNDAAAWAAFDPRTVVLRNGRYQGMSAWFGVSADTPGVYRNGNETTPDPTQSDWDTNSDDHAAVANALCSLLGSHGVECAVVGVASSHDYAGAVTVFAKALPWLAGRIGTPGVASTTLAGAPAG